MIVRDEAGWAFDAAGAALTDHHQQNDADNRELGQDSLNGGPFCRQLAELMTVVRWFWIWGHRFLKLR